MLLMAQLANVHGFKRLRKIVLKFIKSVQCLDV